MTYKKVVRIKDKRIFFVSEHYLSLYPNSTEFFIRGMPVQRAFEAVAKEKGLDAVIDSSAVIYGADDITQDVIKKFRRGKLK